MKLKQIVIENVRSFKERTTIRFLDDINIFIGPNGGGKSNLLDVISITLKHFFLKTYGIHQSNRGDKQIFELREQSRYGNISELLDKHTGNEDLPSYIGLTLGFQDSDRMTVDQLKLHKEKMEIELGKYKQDSPITFEFLDDLSNDSAIMNREFVYTIENNTLSHPADKISYSVLSFLHHYELLNLLFKGVTDSYLPQLVLNFSPYRIGGDIRLSSQLPGTSIIDEFRSSSSVTSRGQTNIFSLATNYFAMKYVDCLHNDGNSMENFNSDKEVLLLSGHLDKIGYKFEISTINKYKNEYEVVLTKTDGTKISLNQLSSGEKEILHFIFGIFTYNVTAGLVIIDEPELHLHPRWQILLIDLLRKISESRSLQLFIVTHSPTFINQLTLENVYRIYLDKGVSAIVKPNEDQLPEIKDLLKIIKTSNSEKLFFADVVILVEGITDKIVFEHLSTEVQSKSDKIVEIIEVNGKNEFNKYMEFLKVFEIQCFIIADRDFAWDIGDEDIKRLFSTDLAKIDDDVLKSRTSQDGRTLSGLLKDTIDNPGDCGDKLKTLREFWTYLESRNRKLKHDITEPELEQLYAFIDSKKTEKIFILRYGELEDYFPALRRSSKNGFCS